MLIASDYRKILQQELDQRKRVRSEYSLTAFAKDLDLSPSRLSEVLSGKQGLSRNRALQIAVALKLEKRQSEVFCDLVESEHARSRVGRELARIRLEKHKIDTNFFTLEQDAFKAVSDWYHFALIQVMALPEFDRDPKWIAKALDITVSDASSAIERLKRLGLIEETDGKLREVHSAVQTTDNVPSEAIRKFHKQVLQKALHSIDAQSVNDRYLSSVLIPTDRKMVPMMNKWIKSFKSRTSKRLSETPNLNSVYCLSVQFFDLTPSLKKKGNAS